MVVQWLVHESATLATRVRVPSAAPIRGKEADVEHQMILFSADLKSIHARLAKKFNAGEVQLDERRIRNAEAEGSSPPISPRSEGEKA